MVAADSSRSRAGAFFAAGAAAGAAHADRVAAVRMVAAAVAAAGRAWTAKLRKRRLVLRRWLLSLILCVDGCECRLLLSHEMGR